jgi:hypothetical protein
LALAAVACGLVAGALLILAGADAAAADAPAPAAAPTAKTPSLPAAPNRVGRLRRDKDGKIVPDGPPLPPDENATRPPPAEVFPVPSFLAPPASQPHTALPYDTSYLESLQDRQVHARRARLKQAEIDRILYEEAAARSRGRPADGHGLTPREAALVRDLARQDEEVQRRAKRQYLIGQPYAAHPEFWYVIGPRSRQYAVTGLTRFDAAMIEGDPAATLKKLQTLRRAALAPLAPTDEDYVIVQELDRLIDVLRRQIYGTR